MFDVQNVYLRTCIGYTVGELRVLNTEGHRRKQLWSILKCLEGLLRTSNVWVITTLGNLVEK